MANSALCGALLTTQPNTWVAAHEAFGTRLVAALAITHLSAQFCALKVGTLPPALLLARFAWLTTRVSALAVHTVVATLLRTGGAVACTGHLTDVAAEQSSATFGLAPLVHSALSASVAGTCANSLKTKYWFNKTTGIKSKLFVLVP